MPAAPQFARMLVLLLSPQRMHGSMALCGWKPVWLPRNSSYRPGARYEVPMVPRRRSDGMICQFRPVFQTLSVLPVES